MSANAPHPLSINRQSCISKSCQVNWTIENSKYKPFFTINNSYTSSFTLYIISLYLESSLLFAKHCLIHFLNQNFSYSSISKVYCVIYIFQFLKSFPNGVTCSKQWKHEFVKICLKSNEQNYLKSIIKAQEQHKWCCSDIIIVNFRGVGIESVAKHLRWSVFFNSTDQS